MNDSGIILIRVYMKQVDVKQRQRDVEFYNVHMQEVIYLNSAFVSFCLFSLLNANPKS